MKEPIRHHYIPQFILRNFADKDNNVCYFDKKTGKRYLHKTCDVFMSRNLYRDEINYPENPTRIEQDLGRFEGEVSQVLKRFFCEREITLTCCEDEKLKLFFAIMGFRTEKTKALFSRKLSDWSKKFYAQWQWNGDFQDLWKRNLGYLVNCRSLKDVYDHPAIDAPMKIFMRCDIFGVFGQYFAVAEVAEGNNFIIGDTYPVVITGTMAWGDVYPMYRILPLSSKRVLFLVSLGADATPRDVLPFRPCILGCPKAGSDSITVRLKTLYPEEVQYINRVVEKEAEKGFIFKV